MAEGMEVCFVFSHFIPNLIHRMNELLVWSFICFYSRTFVGIWAITVFLLFSL